MPLSQGSFGRLFVIFRVGPHRFALSADHVIEICEAPQGALPALAFAHRGRDLPLEDLRARFGVNASGDARAIIVAHAPEGSGPLALLVDEVSAVIPLDPQAVLDLPDPLHPFLGQDIEGLCVLQRETNGEAGEPSQEVVALLGLGALRTVATSPASEERS